MAARMAFGDATLRTRSRLILILIVASAIGCAHTEAVGPAQAPDEKRADDSASVVPHKKLTSDLKGANGERQNISIATSPTALLKPGAARAIQEKLSHHGDLQGDIGSDLDGRTRDALARFQRGHDLPATGIPDDATVRKLGLNPQDLFRSGNDQAPK